MKKIFLHTLAFACSKTAWQTYAIFSGNLVSMAAAFFFIVTLIRVLSVEDFGYFSALFSLLLLVSDLADFGIGSSLSRFLPPLSSEEKKQDMFLKTAFVLQFASAAIVGVVLYIFSRLISDLLFHTGAYAGLVAVTGFGIAGAIMTNFFLFALLAKEKFWIGSIYSAIGGTGRLIALACLVFVGHVMLGPVVWGVAWSFFILAIMGCFLVGRKFLSSKFHRADMRRMFSFSTFLAIARGLTAMASRIDVLMIVSWIGPAAAGNYATASRVASLYALFSGSFSTVMAPKMSGATDKKEVIQIVWMTIGATCALIATILIPLVWSEFFLVMLFGEEKGLPAVSFFRALLVSMMFFVGSIPAVTVALYHLHKPHILTINSVMQLIVVAGLNTVFLPYFGAIGAAYSLIVAYAASFVVTSIMSWYYWRKNYANLSADHRSHGSEK